MIAYLRGQLLDAHVGNYATAILDCNGVGYEVALSALDYGRLPKTGAPVALHIYTHIREDQFALFGFFEAPAKALFLKLIAVTGVGPKAAVDMMSSMTVAEIVAALRGNDLARLVKLKGVGKKTAERLVLELRGKLDAFGVEAAAAAPQLSPLEDDVLSALVNLGYQRAATEKALEKVMTQTPGAGFELLFRRTLEALSRS